MLTGFTIGDTDEVERLDLAVCIGVSRSVELGDVGIEDFTSPLASGSTTVGADSSNRCPNLALIL